MHLKQTEHQGILKEKNPHPKKELSQSSYHSHTQKKKDFTMSFEEIYTEVNTTYMNLLQLKLYTHVI